MTTQDLLYQKTSMINELVAVRKKSLGEMRDRQERCPSFYTTKLSVLLLSCEKVLQNQSLRSGKWTKGCYDQLSGLITKNLNNRLSNSAKITMGTSISSKTLQKIVTNTYRLSYPIDPRALNTLNKVVIFLGYDDWNDFVLKQSSTIAKEDYRTEIKIVTEIVRKAVALEFISYSKLSTANNPDISSYIIRNSPAYNSIQEVLENKKQLGQSLSNPNNPSCYEILELEVLKIEGRKAHVQTKEYWFLSWWDAKMGQYAKRFKNISDHIYVLQKCDGKQWRVKTNASTSDIMAL